MKKEVVAIFTDVTDFDNEHKCTSASQLKLLLSTQCQMCIPKRQKIILLLHTYTILPKVLGHPLLIKGLTTLVISMSTNLNVEAYNYILGSFWLKVCI